MSAIRNFGLMYLRNLRQFPRIPVVLVFGIVMPIIQLVLFGNLFSGVTELPGFKNNYPGVEYQSFIVPAVLLFTIFVGMANSSAAFIVDLRTGYFDKLRTTPARPGTVIVARMCAEMTRVAMQGTFVLCIALLLGASVKSGFLGAILMIVIATLFSACVAGLGVMALAMQTKSDQATQSAFPLFFVLMFLSSAFQAKEAITKDWLRTVVDLNPVNYLVEALRTLMIGVKDGNAMVESYPWDKIGIVLGAAAIAAALFSFLNMRVYKKTIEGK